MATHKIAVSGRVQGVGFRAFVQGAALRHGLVGEVWNERDKSVLIIARGEPGQVDKLISDLNNGPGRVDFIASEVLQSDPDYADFAISYSR